MNNTFLLALVVVVGSRTWYTSGRPPADLWQTSSSQPLRWRALLQSNSQRLWQTLLQQTSGRHVHLEHSTTSGRHVHLEHTTTSAAPGGPSSSSSGRFLSLYRTFDGFIGYSLISSGGFFTYSLNTFCGYITYNFDSFGGLQYSLGL